MSKVREWLTAYGFIAPAMIAILLISVYPLVFGVSIAFTDMSVFNYLSHGYKFIGFANFSEMLTDPETWILTYRTVIWTVINVFLHVSLGIAFAMLLSKPWLKLKPIFRLILILPWAIPSFISIQVWHAMFNEQFGAINQLLTMIGFHAIPWLTSPTWAFLAVIITNVWLGVPFMMLIALGGLNSIPEEIQEAAYVDGASPWQTTRYIILPLLLRTMVPAIVLGIIWTFNKFDVIYLITQGGPQTVVTLAGHQKVMGATDLLITKIYKTAFQYPNSWGAASALGYLVFLVLLAMSLLNLQIQNFVKE
ncbi:carbohydrate ABC transporter permease [Coprothermobacter platensis]|uniref:carbohydrate ABC transporter permease n=1 Tax=Coprothermobacter platensis TaxID=108819 RepID=UPI00038254FE|nr:sugar ABC transporter permease [Coprothermobacter platensis]